MVKSDSENYEIHMGGGQPDAAPYRPTQPTLPKNTSLTSHPDRRVQFFGIQTIGIYPIDVATAAFLICIKTHLGRLQLHATDIPPIIHSAKQALSIFITVTYSKRGA